MKNRPIEFGDASTDSSTEEFELKPHACEDKQTLTETSASKKCVASLQNNRFCSFYLKNRIWLNFAILTLLFVCNCFASWVTFVSFSVLTVFALVDDLSNGFSYLIFAIPFSMIYPFASLLFYVCILVAYMIKFFLIYFIKEKGKISWIHLLFVGLFLIYAVMPIGPYSINMIYKLAIILFLYAFLFAFSKKPKVFKFDFNCNVFAAAILISCVMGTLWFVSPYLQSIITNINGAIRRYQALTTNTNALAMMCEVALALLAYKIVKNKKDWLSLVLFACVAVAGIFTISKLYFITLIVILIGLFIGMMTVNWKKTLIATSILLAFAAIVIMTIYFVKPSLLTLVINRFGKFTGSFDEIMINFTTGRWTLWKDTVANWGANPIIIFFGRGIGAGALPGMVVSPHNAYLSLIDQLGIVGAALFITPFALLIKDIIKNKDIKISKAISIPIVVLALMFMAEDILFFIIPF